MEYTPPPEPRDFEGPPPPPPPHLPPQPPPPPPPPPPPGLKRREVVPPLVLRALILKVLEGGPAHGYEIAEKVSAILHQEVAKSVVYAALSTMEKLGLVLPRWEIEEGRARKKYYITDEGVEYLKAAKEALRKLKDALDYIFP